MRVQNKLTYDVRVSLIKLKNSPLQNSESDRNITLVRLQYCYIISRQMAQYYLQNYDKISKCLQ